MPWQGQASGEWTESSAYLREFYKGIHNSLGVLTTDSFTINNPKTGKAGNTEAAMLVGVTKVGVLSGSVAFTRPDAGNNYIGPPLAGVATVGKMKPLGVFINDAKGHDFENTPGVASNRGPYVCGRGTYGTRLYETQILVGGNAGDALVWSAGDYLYASKNGLLTNVEADAFEVVAAPNGAGLPAATIIGVVKFAPEAAFAELIFDLRI